MTVNLPDGFIEAITAGALGFQAWLVSRSFAADRHLAILSHKIAHLENRLISPHNEKYTLD